MTDFVIEAVRSGNLNEQNVNAVLVRECFKVDHGDYARDRLDRGRAIIDCPMLLDQYLYTHGKRITTQLRDSFLHFSVSFEKAQIIEH